MTKKPDRKKELKKELGILFKEKSYKAHGDSCILCGNKGLYHHYIMKSRNGLYKFDVRNAICLCQRHHYIIHHAPPTEQARIIQQIREKKGKEWCEWVDIAEHTHGESFSTVKWL